MILEMNAKIKKENGMDDKIRLEDWDEIGCRKQILSKNHLIYQLFFLTFKLNIRVHN